MYMIHWTKNIFINHMQEMCRSEGTLYLRHLSQSLCYKIQLFISWKRSKNNITDLQGRHEVYFYDACVVSLVSTAYSEYQSLLENATTQC